MALAAGWGDIPAWREDFARTAAMRGVGWVILYHDPLAGRLFNWWVSDHEVNHPDGLHPLLVMDVFEHAWMVDYGAGEKGKYVKAFLENVPGRSWSSASRTARTGWPRPEDSRRHAGLRGQRLGLAVRLPLQRNLQPGGR